jgi:hypothetical protein
MADTQPELQRGPEVHVYHYAPPAPCTACGGSGRIVLFVTARPCEACAGSGQIWGEPRHEHTPARLGYWRRECSFDDKGRLATVCEWFEPVEVAAPGDSHTRGRGDPANDAK